MTQDLKSIDTLNQDGTVKRYREFFEAIKKTRKKSPVKKSDVNVKKTKSKSVKFENTSDPKS